MRRTGRPFYWIMAGASVLAFAVCRYLMDDPPTAMLFVTLFLFIFGTERLHNLGRSGWWALALIAVPCAIVVPVGFLGYQKGVELALWYVIAGVELAVLGVLPGQPGANRYGEPDRPARV